MTTHELHPAQRQGAHHIAEFLRPRTIADAVRILADRGERARIIAGGTDLLLELDRGARPGIDTLVDLSGIPGLDEILESGNDIVLGCLVTHSQVVVSPLVATFAFPLLQACGEIGAPQLRNRATVVGNIVTASPANDTITPLHALEATVEVVGVDGSRQIPFAEFHSGFRATALELGDVITALRVPKMRVTERGVFAKLGLRKAQAISVLHATAIVDLEDDVVRGAKVAIGSATPVIVRADGVEAGLVGSALTSEAIAAAVSRVHGSIAPIDDVRADAMYRSEQAEFMLRRMLTSLADGAERVRQSESPITLWTGDEDHRWVKTDSSERITNESLIQVTVNGQHVEAAHAPGLTLLHWLRDVAAEASGMSLTGTKEGCAEGECGACTVLMDGNAVVSCLVSAAQADGRSITTIEGVAGNGAHDVVQEAFLDHGAVQCGYCIPGFVMSVEALRAERGTLDRASAVEGLGGNLCRCTGYYKIIDAVIEAGAGE
ncbi:nicotinate dehydrogenase small FeS subunit [bacterium BMS3Bbin02]|nr:nicotinate dehydrogenase small FeS subunit [bacterium BMS3Bbin02]